MDGIHDLGGMQGFGAVERERDEPVFHADWERKVWGLGAALFMSGRLNGGQFRHSIERMDPAHYLNSSYYEHWLTGFATLVTEKEIASVDEFPPGFPLSRPAADVSPEPGADSATPKFAVGDEVRVRLEPRTGHTRCPRYVRGRRGVIVRLDGNYSVPDVEAHVDGRRIEPTYSVRFSTAELWGDQSADTVHVDLWESYLEDGTA